MSLIKQCTRAGFLALALMFHTTLSAKTLETVTIEDVLRHAASESPAMIEAMITVARNDADRLRGWVTYAPEVNMTYQFGAFHEIRKSIESDDATRIGAQYSIVASHPVYHWGAIQARRDAGFAMESIAQDEAVIDFLFLIRELRTSYNDLIVEKAELDVLKKRIDDMNAEVDRAKALVKEGGLAATRVEELTLDLQNLELEHTFKQNEVENMLVTFKNESGYLDLELHQIPSDIALPAYSINHLEAQYRTFIESGFDRSVATDLANKQYEAIESQLTIVRSKQKPTFDFRGGMTQQPHEVNNDYELQTIFFIGIGGSWNLFDRAETSTNERSLLLRKRQVNTRLATTRAKLYAEAKNALDLIRTTGKASELRRKQLDLVNRKLDLKKSQYREGTIGREELNEAELKAMEVNVRLLSDKAKIANAYYSFLGSIFSDQAAKFFDPKS